MYYEVQYEITVSVFLFEISLCVLHAL